MLVEGSIKDQCRYIFQNLVEMAVGTGPVYVGRYACVCTKSCGFPCVCVLAYNIDSVGVLPVLMSKSYMHVYWLVISKICIMLCSENQAHMQGGFKEFDNPPDF